MGPLFVNPAPVRATAPRLNGVLPTQTIIDGNQIDRVFDAQTGASGTEFSNLTIRNGRISGMTFGGGGIFSEVSTAISNSTIVGNIAGDVFGGGIQIMGQGSPIIVNNTRLTIT